MPQVNGCAAYENIAETNMAVITKNVFSNMNCPVSLHDFCDGAALILTTVFYLLKQVALSFVCTSCRMITAHTTVSVV